MQKVGKRYLADYEVEDSVIIPDPPQPPQKPDTSPCGRIIYNPDKCKWTNRGKISNGVGDYSIDIEATKPRVVETGVTESHRHSSKRGDYCYCSRKFDVVYYLDRIETSGATNDTVRGSKGTIHIRQEGGGQEVHSTGYWKWAHTVYGKNFDTEVPIKILSSKDTKSLEGFTRSRTIDFDTWRGMKVEVWYKFVSYHNCNFIRVIHYDDPAMPIKTVDNMEEK